MLARPSDIFDLLLHGIPWFLVLAKLGRLAWNHPFACARHRRHRRLKPHVHPGAKPGSRPVYGRAYHRPFEGRATEGEAQPVIEGLSLNGRFGLRR
jgi:hypothetical protein